MRSIDILAGSCSTNFPATVENAVGKCYISGVYASAPYPHLGTRLTPKGTTEVTPDQGPAPNAMLSLPNMRRQHRESGTGEIVTPAWIPRNPVYSGRGGYSGRQRVSA